VAKVELVEGGGGFFVAAYATITNPRTNKIATHPVNRASFPISFFMVDPSSSMALYR
jgi:hypothetical protein